MDITWMVIWGLITTLFFIVFKKIGLKSLKLKKKERARFNSIINKIYLSSILFIILCSIIMYLLAIQTTNITQVNIPSVQENIDQESINKLKQQNIQLNIDQINKKSEKSYDNFLKK